MNIDNLVADTTHYSIKNQACYIVIYWGKLKSSSFKNASRAANLQLSLQKLDLKTSSEIYASIIFLLPLGMFTSDLIDGAGLAPPFITSQPLLVIPLFTTVSAYFILFIGKYISELFISLAYIANNIKK